MKKKIYAVAYLATTILMFGACSLDTEPTAEYTEDTFWFGAENAKAGLTGCYLPMLNDNLFGGYSIGLEECATPNAYDNDNYSGWNSIALGQQTTETSVFNSRWNDAYIGIGRCNMLLAKIDANKELSSAEIQQMKAQARFLRALYYNVLVTYYNKVPLITDAPNMSQAKAPRTDRATIINFLIEELDAIAKILPRTAIEKGRPTSGSALGLKARILLFEASLLCNPENDTEKWRKAANAAYAVIDLKAYGLYADYRKLFLEEGENSNECIFDVQAVKTPVGLGHSMDLIMRQYNAAAPLKSLIDAYWTKDGTERINPVYGSFNAFDEWVSDPASYQNLDPRFYKTVVYPGATFMGETVKDNNSNVNFKLTYTGYTFKKYTIYDEASVSAADVGLGAKNSPVNIMVLRYADILMMYAEAKNELGELTQDVWDITIGAIRRRAGFTAAAALNWPGSDKATLEKHIRYERRIEFAGEGMYYNDIRRWKTAEDVMNNANILKKTGERIITRYFDKNRDYWWPVSAIQLTANPALRPNNEGWE